MRRVGTRNKDKAGGYYIRYATQGFYGDRGEGKYVLERMGISTDKLPFSMAYYLKHHNVQWRDINGKLACISFCVTEHRIEFYASYLGNFKKAILFREWESYEDQEDVLCLESEAIGNMSMLCIFEKLENK